MFRAAARLIVSAAPTRLTRAMIVRSRTRGPNVLCAPLAASVRSMRAAVNGCTKVSRPPPRDPLVRPTTPLVRLAPGARGMRKPARVPSAIGASAGSTLLPAIWGFSADLLENSKNVDCEVPIYKPAFAGGRDDLERVFAPRTRSGAS